MDVSIIIVNWNTKDLILKCIKSIIDAKSEYSQEIIVVDNASSDGSVEAMIKEYPNIIILGNENNLGFARANNIGIMRSTGRYICLVNSDVEVFEDTVPGIIQYMDNNPGVGIVGPRILFPDRTLQNSCRKYPTLWTKLCEALALNRIFHNVAFFSGEHMEYFCHDRVIRVESLAGCFLMIRKAALNGVGLFDEQFFIYSEETDLCKRFSQAGWDIVFLPEIAAIHHCRASSSKDPIRFSIEQEKSVMKYWRKHHATLERMLFYILLFIHHTIRYLWSLMRYVMSYGKMRDAKERMAFHRERLITMIQPQDSTKN